MVEMEPDITQKPAIPEVTLSKWQRVVDLISEMAGVPAALIMKTDPPRHAVFVTSLHPENPYQTGQTFELNEKLYCFGVFRKDGELCVEDAHDDPAWDDNQDLDDDMSFYVGLPLKWPDGEIFGTICMLDRRRNAQALAFRSGLRAFCGVVENDLALLMEVERRKQVQAELRVELASRAKAIAERTRELEEANTALRVLVRNMQATRADVGDTIGRQIKELVMPQVGKLRHRHARDAATVSRLSLIEESLARILSDHVTPMSQVLEALTPTEVEIAQLIVQGRNTKEIAGVLARGTSTVDFHRNNIRRKLGLTGRAENLRQYLTRNLGAAQQ